MGGGGSLRRIETSCSVVELQNCLIANVPVERMVIRLGNDKPILLLGPVRKFGSRMGWYQWTGWYGRSMDKTKMAQTWCSGASDKLVTLLHSWCVLEVLGKEAGPIVRRHMNGPVFAPHKLRKIVLGRLHNALR